MSEKNQPRLKIEFPVQDKAKAAWIGAGYTYEDDPPASLTFRRVRKQTNFRDKIDLRKGPCNRKVRTMIRKKAKDWNQNGKLVEYLVYTEDWDAKDWLGNDISTTAEHQGESKTPLMKDVYSIDPKTGAEIKNTISGGSRLIYDIPVPSKETERKKLVDDIINKKYANVTNITEKDEVLYYFDWSGSEKRSTFRDNSFNYENFIKMSFDQAWEYSNTKREGTNWALPPQVK